MAQKGFTHDELNLDAEFISPKSVHFQFYSG